MASQHEIDDLPNVVKADLVRMMLGDRVGLGASREVYQFMANGRWIIKLEVRDTFQNVHEHEVWKLVRDTKWRRWFAPVVMVSECGQCLVMEQTVPLPLKAKRPAMMPSFFDDLKPENFGTFEGRIVCHDYGLTKLLSQGLDHARMVKARWVE